MFLWGPGGKSEIQGVSFMGGEAISKIWDDLASRGSWKIQEGQPSGKLWNSSLVTHLNIDIHGK